MCVSASLLFDPRLSKLPSESTPTATFAEAITRMAAINIPSRVSRERIARPDRVINPEPLGLSTFHDISKHVHQTRWESLLGPPLTSPRPIQEHTEILFNSGCRMKNVRYNLISNYATLRINIDIYISRGGNKKRP